MTRRFPFKYALGSTTGAGGIGAASPLTTGAATGALLQLLQLLQGAAAHPVSQPASQQLLSRRLNNLARSPQLFFFDPHPSQPLSQAAISQPQLGAAPQGSQEAISQPQVGAAQADSHPQEGSQAGAHAVSQPQDGAQPMSHPLSQPLLHNPPFSLPNSSSNGLRRGLLQQESQAAISQPQLGAAPQGSQEAISHPHVGAAQAVSQPQDGSQAGAHAVSQPQDGSQALAQPSLHAEISQPQVGSAAHPVSQQALSHPLPFRPSIRSKSPPPKLGVLKQAPSIKDPITMFHFIEPQLPKTMNLFSGTVGLLGV